MVCFYSYRAADVNPLVLECRSRGICHGRKNKKRHLPRTEAEAEAFATEGHGISRNQKSHMSFRAGCVSDGIKILFGKGPFDRLRDRGSFGTVSELAELAVKLREEQKYLSTSL